ncbi:hypothetical protein FJZ53_01635 [Candidatus Woesearchaeota archaeon]|nr:hypothetical protein [Candidatus Woesearchaeota archaeon]
MPESSRKIPTWGYEILKEGNENVMRINVEDWPYVPSIEDSEMVMALTIDKLVEAPSVHRLIFMQRKNYVYDYTQTQMLLEIAGLYSRLVKQKRALNVATLGIPGVSDVDVPRRHGIIQYVVFNLLRSDPIGAYAELKRLLREEDLRLKRMPTQDLKNSEQLFINLLEEIRSLLGKTRIIELAKPYVEGYHIGDRSVYAMFFKPAITPDFFFTRLMAQMPTDGEQLDIYKVGNAEVTLLRMPDDIKILYHLIPPEFKLNEDKYELLDLARSVVAEHQPKAEEFLEPEKVRQTFFNIGKDLITELAEQRNIEISYEELEELTNILVRYTVGFGLIEVLLEDQKVQDLVINGPIGVTPIFLVHADQEECVTNIIPSRTDAESWASKFRMLSGRPLDEANPVLDTELILPKARARVAIIQNPLNPFGLAYALRRHRDKPWTLPLFIQQGMISPLGAGLMSFLIDGARTLLIAGTRSSGKCVEGDTLIQLSDGNILPIKDMVKGEEKQVGNDLVYKDNKSPFIVSLDAYNLKDLRLSDYWKRKVDKKLVKIKTRSGKEIVTTEEHPYFTFNHGIKSVFAGLIRKGQLIATPRQISIQGKKQVISLKSPDEVIDKGDYYIIKGATNSNPITFPKYVSVEFAEFLGYLLADGHIDKCQVNFFNSNRFLREKYKKLVSIFNVNFKERRDRTTWVIQINSRILSRVLSETFGIPLGNKAGNIKIPKEILMSDNNVLASFLKAYADSDGSIPNGKRDLEICTKSKLMSKQLQLAFLRYGIVAFCKNKVVNKETYYRVLIRGSFVNEYAKHIGFNHPSKLERLEQIMQANTIDNTNVDIIPQGGYYLRELRRRLRIMPKQIRQITGKDYWAYENNEYRVTRKWFKKFVSFYKTRYERLKRNSSKIEGLTRLVKLQEEYASSMRMLDKLKNLLGVSYTGLAKSTSFSDTWLRKALQKNRQINLQDLNSMTGAHLLLENRLMNLKLVLNFEADINYLKRWVDNTNLTYASLAKDVGISESMLKGYAYGGFKIPQEKGQILAEHLNRFKMLFTEKLEKSEMLLENLEKNFKDCMMSYTGTVDLLKELKSELNIKNYELADKNLGVQTVSNFFKSKHKTPSFKTIYKIAKKIIEIHDKALSDETEGILDTADSLSNSDLFWDEVVHVEKVHSDEEWVYDLTVPGTHNFVANGIIAHNTSMLGANLVEVMRKYRIITVEDTLELPTEALRKLGYNIQPMKVRSALMAGGTEVPADEGIRTSLRMGDSSLIIGEIRSTEAFALYEAMRIGALANVVAGTIHGDSPYGVFDRVVNDLKVPATSFKATDIVMICNPIKSPDGLKKWRRVTSITEVRKHWSEDPIREQGFVDLMKYNAKTDQLEPTDDLINGESEILKSIAGNIKEWAGDWDAVWDNITLRSKLKETLLDYSKKLKDPDMLEAEFVVMANDQFHRAAEIVKEEVGFLDSKKIFFEWEEWLKRKIRERKGF